MKKRKILIIYTKYILLYFLPFVLVTGIMSYTIYKQDIRTFYAVLEHNEGQILEFQESIIKEHLKGLKEDITYLQNFSRTSEFINSNFNPKINLARIFGSFLKRRTIYSSVRIIDSGGFERFRLNFDGTSVTEVPPEKLQSKGSRYYFNDIMNMNPGDTYFSRFDFNYEGGKLQFPYKPVLRISKLLLDRDGDKRAFIILNYRGSDIIQLVNKYSVYSYGKIFLQNDEGIIISTDASLSEEKSAIIDFLKTDYGKNFFKKAKGQLNIDSGYLTYKKIKIIDGNYSPKINLISFIDKNDIVKHTKDDFQRGIFIFLFFSFLSLIVSFFIAKNTIHKNKTNLLINERAKIFDYNPAPVLKTSNNGEILSSNIAAKNILGLTRTPPSIFEVFKNLNEKDLYNAISSKINFFEYHISDKTYFFTYIKEATTKQIFFYGTDITDNYKTREDLRNFQTAVKQSANVIVFTDLEGRVLFTNNAFEKITGYSSEEVLGKKTSVLNSGFHSDAFFNELWSTISNGQVWAGEFYNKRKDGSFYWEKATISPVTDNEGNPKFYIAVKEDITEKKEIEEKLKQKTQDAEKAQIEAESANILKSTFLANMSHEIRTPMNAILGFTRLLLDKETHKKDKEMLSIIFNSGKNLLTLINDILDFSKIEANEIEINIAKMDILNFFESIKDLFYIQIKNKNLEFNLNLSDNLPKNVFGDENRIRQILINIIGNAIKFTESGKIDIKADWIFQKLVIIVSDTGIGIKKDNLKDIFSPFKQSDSSIDRKYEGTGLGLAISLRLAEMMNGELKVESKIDKGSVFTISLALKPCLESDEISNENNQTDNFYNNSRALVEGWLGKVKGDKVLTSITKDAIADLPGHLSRLESVINNKDSKQLQAITHELMGSTGNLGMTEIYNLLKELNAGIKNKTIDETSINNIYQSIKTIVKGIPKQYLMGFTSETLPEKDDKIDINILTADDSSVNRLLIEAMLSSINVKSDFAENGIEVLDRLKEKKYDLLLLDIQMPKMDGIETIKRIRENNKFDDLYVFAVTANAMKGDAQKYLDIGCNDYISKPIQKDLFLQKIEQQIQKLSNSQSNMHILPDKTEIENIIISLKQEMKIFNPGRVNRIADRLKAYEENKKISIIIRKLNKTADSFDSQGLKNIINMLMELK